MADSTVLSAVQRAQAERQLERVLGSTAFSLSTHLQHIFRYLLQQSLAGNADRLSQTSIAIDVLGRDASFDPNIDSVVRVEVGRLRAKLHEYYHQEGRNDAVRFELPKGHYILRTIFPQDSDRSRSSANGQSNKANPGTHQPPAQSMGRNMLKGHGVWLLSAWVAILIIFLFLAQHQAWYPFSQSAATPGLAAPPTDPTGVHSARYQSIAVLPFTEFADTPGTTDFLANGLLDELVMQLSKLKGLRVISRNSVVHYHDNPAELPRIARELNVDSVVQGSLQRTGNNVRINIHLIDTKSGEELWAESFDRKLSTGNIFDIERHISVATAKALQTTLTNGSALPSGPLTDSLEAYEAYLKGRQQYENRTSRGLANARVLFQRAIDYDPNFALAYVGMANAWMLSAVYGGDESAANAEPLIRQALKLDDHLGQAYAALALLKHSAGDYASAESNYQRALELNPNLVQALRWYSILLTDIFGRRQQGLELIRQAALLDPLSGLIRATYGDDLAGLNRLQEALTQYHKAIELDPDLARVYMSMGLLYATVYQQPIEAARWAFMAQKIKPNVPRFTTVAATILILDGNFDDARVWLDNLRRRKAFVDANYLCVLLAGALNDDTNALQCGREALKHPVFQVFQEQILFVMRNADLRKGHLQKARNRYAAYFPELMRDPPQVNRGNFNAAIDLAYAMQKLGKQPRARHLLQQALLISKRLPRFAFMGSGSNISEAEIYALRGEKTKALQALGEAIDDGWILYWWRVPKKNPNFESLWGEPTFGDLLQKVTRRLAATRKEIARRQDSGEILRLSAVLDVGYSKRN